MLLVLDIDETLVHARLDPLHYPPDFYVYDYRVYRRPHLERFIEACLEMFDVGVWSSATDAYVEHMVQEIFPNPAALKFAWGRSRCQLRSIIADEYDEIAHRAGHLNYLKPLKKLTRHGWSMNRMLIVDDSPEKCVLNYGNAIYPRPFEGNEYDDELPRLGKYLETLKDAEDVRKIEKRTWRQKI